MSVKDLREDLGILSKYFKKHILFYWSKLAAPMYRFFQKKELSQTTFLETILELEGAKKLGGKFLGKKNTLGITTLYYAIERFTADNSESYYYVAYILRTPEYYQVAVDEKWEDFNKTVEDTIRQNKKANINVRKREGEFHVKSRSSRGRKVM